MKRVLVAMMVLAGCAQEPQQRVEEVLAKDYGKELFNDPKLSETLFNNGFSCATCHATSDDDARILPGHNLAGVTQRARLWGGNERELLTAVNFCFRYFMRGQPLTRDEEKSKALYEYLASLPVPADNSVRPYSVVKNVQDVPRGDVTRGQAVYDGACKSCHGAIHSGEGRISETASVLPEVANDYDALFPGVPHSLVFVEKVRHGQFFGVGGNMPLFSTETLSDGDLGALLAYLGL